MTANEKILLSIIKYNQPGYAVKNWSAIAAENGLSVATTKQRYAVLKNQHHEDTQNGPPPAPAIKRRNRRNKSDITPADNDDDVEGDVEDDTANDATNLETPSAPAAPAAPVGCACKSNNRGSKQSAAAANSYDESSDEELAAPPARTARAARATRAARPVVPVAPVAPVPPARALRAARSTRAARVAGSASARPAGSVTRACKQSNKQNVADDNDNQNEHNVTRAVSAGPVSFAIPAPAPAPNVASPLDVRTRLSQVERVQQDQRAPAYGNNGEDQEQAGPARPRHWQHSSSLGLKRGNLGMEERPDTKKPKTSSIFDNHTHEEVRELFDREIAEEEARQGIVWKEEADEYVPAGSQSPI
ncbi:hypothetical protein PGQ11_014606 [Apiospora arundinis]|uniref:Uncharacterized protein n=1 Tax=Apiospora arundinis TaxID=335852 RepID=A0ABR2HSS2_9PEZI